eukprot:gene20409-7413_t
MSDPEGNNAGSATNTSSQTNDPTLVWKSDLVAEYRQWEEQRLRGGDRVFGPARGGAVAEWVVPEMEELFLLEKKKLVLVLDIDNTLLHATAIPPESMQNVKIAPEGERLTKSNIITHIFMVSFEETIRRPGKAPSKRQKSLLVKFRPDSIEFLQMVSKHYLITIYTKSIGSYAHK